MARTKSSFVCQSCGAVYPRWTGKCEACDAWNSIVEETVEAAPIGGGKRSGGGGSGKALDFVSLKGTSEERPRLTSGIAELDRVLGGGLVDGSATLIGGDPGIGKSTLLLQAAAALSAQARVAYISGEEAIDQIRMRASRLAVSDAGVDLASATSVRDILASLDRPDGPRIAIIDSIQTMYVDLIDSAPGTVGQVRASAQELIRVAKRRGIALLLVGHVTKEGAIAGPRVLEHMVDTVLYFEGERGHPFRILRGVKNRFGPTDEIGVFDMTERGLEEVKNPSALFLADRQDGVAGAAVFAGIEGSRPMLVEIQALVAPSAYGTPRRAVVGWDSNRLAMLLAVLEARGGLDLSGRDVYLNVAGGLRIGEPAADLAVAAAIVSSLTGVPVTGSTVLFGEVGLSGEVRAVGRPDARLKEAAKLGFHHAIAPKGRGAKDARNGSDMTVTAVADVGALIRRLEAAADGPIRILDADARR
ncbi:MAG: DNA repair protein RadA [Alphaproteobacteria bacterium]|uniref:DNA repair protein RadA n=1 Tax=Pacificispira sp. TaxID=2888761 RepID=UPI001B1703D1|nr:DNA repair protein RadA [Alphaproteobacteria bacterium]MBO6864129.1 DNA repair protein RadA [Alphaproteobacteria bacterium]